MTTFRLIEKTELADWADALRRCGEYDIYHTAEYHIATQPAEDARLLVVEEGPKIAAFPLIIRSISSVDGLESSPFFDATSSYGYPGPVINTNGREDKDFIAKFQNAIIEAAKNLNVVAIFTRLNPVIENERYLTGLGSVRKHGPTVSIDLTTDEVAQFADYRKSHRYEVRRAAREGMQVVHDREFAYLDSFIELYNETMKRVNAAPEYFFERSYYENLHAHLGDSLQLFVATLNDEPCSASLFLHAGDIVQYHLSGSSAQHAKLAPSKAIINAARQWAKSVGASTFHLGGGVGARQDSLFKLKSGFSSQRTWFHSWSHIVDKDAYQELTIRRKEWNIENDPEKIMSESFFPAYRC